MKIIKSKKGIAYVWLTILMSIFTISLVYIILDPIIQDKLIPLAQENDVNATTLSFITTAWNNFPIILIIGLILYGLAMAQKREPDSGYYG